MNEPAIKGWRLRPPLGGWSVDYAIGDQRWSFNGQPDQIVADLFQIAEKNGAMEEIEEAWDYCNAQWCSADPKRCLSASGEARPKPRVYRGNNHSSVAPRQYGSRIWLWLNTFGMAVEFDKDYWLCTIDRVSRFLDPEISPKTGCVICSNEWDWICDLRPPNLVCNAQDAAKWVWKAHNQVNRKLGKPIVSWESAVVNNFWDIEL